MFHLIKSATRTFLVLTVLTGAIYPMMVTALGLGLFPDAARGSRVERDGRLVGSALIAQKFVQPRYVHPRPSAAEFATVASGASNLAPTSAALKATVESRTLSLGAGAPPELVLASASGLDPHLSPAAARFQVDRIAAARGIGEGRRGELEALFAAHEEAPTFGIFGRPRINVLRLNLELDRRFP